MTYDHAERLSSAVYLEEGVANQHYDEAFTYDKMGNVQGIVRYGLQDNSQYELIDNVSLYYNGNQVVHADDAVTGPNYAGAFHFRDSSGYQWDTEYEYDKNGNLTRDRNKGILQIQYNLLNLPSKTTFSDGYINYQYSASGMKQMVSGYAPGQGYKSQFYLGNYVYSSGTVKQLLVDGGYVTFSGTTPQYHFYVKDHLGNNRMVVNASGTVEQVSHYYAFGGLMGENTGSDVQDFKYNDKELDRWHGLDWYDYNARHMDTARGVFTTMDPLAEKYYDISPYAYCANNPINAIDKIGKDITFLIASKGADGFGHMGAIIGNNSTYYYITAGATNIDDGLFSNSNQEGGISITEIKVPTMGEAITFVRNADTFNSYYDDSITFSTSNKMDKSMLNEATDKQEKFKNGEEHYRLFTNNCADIVKDIFEKGTDSSLHMGISPSPNDNFSSIKDNKEKIQKELNDKMYAEEKK